MLSVAGSPVLPCVVQQPEAAALCLLSGALHSCHDTAVLQDLRPTSQGARANPTDPDIHSRGKVFSLFCGGFFKLLSSVSHNPSPLLPFLPQSVFSWPVQSCNNPTKH